MVTGGCTSSKERIYKGQFKNKNIAVQFTNSKKGKIVIDEREIIPFSYKIEKLNTESKSEIAKKYLAIYRFTIDASYQLNFPLGFYEIDQQQGDTLRGSDYNLVLVK